MAGIMAAMNPFSSLGTAFSNNPASMTARRAGPWTFGSGVPTANFWGGVGTPAPSPNYLSSGEVYNGTAFSASPVASIDHGRDLKSFPFL